MAHAGHPLLADDVYGLMVGGQPGAASVAVMQHWRHGCV